MTVYTYNFMCIQVIVVLYIYIYIHILFKYIWISCLQAPGFIHFCTVKHEDLDLPHMGTVVSKYASLCTLVSKHAQILEKWVREVQFQAGFRWESMTPGKNHGMFLFRLKVHPKSNLTHRFSRASLQRLCRITRQKCDHPETAEHSKTVLSFQTSDLTIDDLNVVAIKWLGNSK